MRFFSDINPAKNKADDFKPVQLCYVSGVGNKRENKEKCVQLKDVLLVHFVHFCAVFSQVALLF